VSLPVFPFRLLAVSACIALASCSSAVRHGKVSREDKLLSERENRRLAGVLTEMAAGWDGMQRGRINERRAAQDRYDRALADFLRQWDGSQHPRYWRSGTVFAGRQQAFNIEFHVEGNDRVEISPTRLDQVILPAKVKPRESDTLAQRPGVGIPVVGHIRRTDESRCTDPFLPPNGGNLTLTAVLEMDAPVVGQPRHCRLHLHNALNVEAVKVNGDERQLAADFTASKQLSLAKHSLRAFAWLGLLFPERTLKDCQLYSMDGYDPKRIPVVFVHGLLSDPHIWLNTVNAISADPKLRMAYQPWYFLYPTAMGIPQSAEMLRESLRQARDHFDPEHDDPGMRQMVLVGHSMGGLLSRMQVIDPGDQLWNALLSKPLPELDVSASARQRLEKNLMFKPQPEIQRLVFIATPHRGSSIASKNIVRRLASLIRLPVDSLLMSQQFLVGNTDALSPQIRDWGVFGLLSIGMLSDKQPYYQGLNAVPIPVQHHSIIGDLGKNNSPASSDGVVVYQSSHLDSAESEKIVPYWHGCVERPEVVQEIMRVLREHLREKGISVSPRN